MTEDRTAPEGYLPSLDSVLEAASLIEAFDIGDPEFGDLLFAALPGTTYALTAFANQAIQGFAKLAGDTPDGVLREMRLILSGVVAAMSAEGEGT